MPKKLAPKKKPRGLVSYISYSMNVHLFVFWLALGMPIPFLRACGSGEQGQEEGGGGAVNEIVDIEQIDPDLAPDPTEKKKCEPFFGGIGVTLNTASGVIGIVHKGYVAERVGLQPGDQLICDEEVIGEVGTPLLLRVRKVNGQIQEFPILRDRICTEDIGKP